MPAVDGELDGRGPALVVEGEGRAARVGGDVGGAHVGALVGSEGEDPAVVFLAHGGHERVVGVEDGRAGRREGADDLGLGIRDGLPGAELPDVRGTDAQDGGDAGTGDSAQGLDVALAARAHLQHEVLRIGPDGAHGDGEADLVVEGGPVGDGGGVSGQDVGEEVLGGGLAG